MPSSALMAPMTRRFVAALERFARDAGVDLVRFEGHERKDEGTQAYLRDFTATEGVLCMGKAQEKARMVRTERRVDPLGRRLPVAGALDGDVLPDGFANRDLRETVAPLLGLSLEAYGRNRMTYDLRRLRLRRLIERIPFTRRYRVTHAGLRTAMCYHRTHAGVLRPALAVVFDAPAHAAARLNRAVDSFDSEVQRLWKGRQLAA